MVNKETGVGLRAVLQYAMGQRQAADLIATLKTLLACENIFGGGSDFNCLEKVFLFLIMMMMVLLSNRTNSAEA